MHFPCYCSGHSLLMLTCSSFDLEMPHNGRPFHFKPLWLSNDDCKQIVHLHQRSRGEGSLMRCGSSILVKFCLQRAAQENYSTRAFTRQSTVQPHQTSTPWEKGKELSAELDKLHIEEEKLLSTAGKEVLMKSII